MNNIKEALAFTDLIMGFIWGITLIEVIPIVASGTTIVFTQLDNVIKILFALVGLIYTIIRMLYFIKKSKQDLRFREQEIIEKERKNLYYNWTEEFNDQSKLEKKSWTNKL